MIENKTVLAINATCTRCDFSQQIDAQHHVSAAFKKINHAVRTHVQETKTKVTVGDKEQTVFHPVTIVPIFRR